MNNYSSFQQILDITKYLINHPKEQTLTKITDHFGISKNDLKDLFLNWTNIDVVKFIDFFNKNTLKEKLSDIAKIHHNTKTTIHIELFKQNEIQDLTIEYGFATTIFGICFIATTHLGICVLSFPDDQEKEEITDLKRKWNGANFVENSAFIQNIADQIFSIEGPKKQFWVLLNGTSFQMQVWDTLSKIQFGKIVSYSQLATLSGTPKAVRAVASAVADNPVSFLIPCHRIIRNEGIIGQYHWKPERKAVMIAWEHCT